MGTATPRTRRASLAPVATIDAAIEAFNRRCKAKSLSDHTVSFYKYRLEAFRKFLNSQYEGVGLADISPDIIRDFIADEAERVSAVTADDGFVTVRALFRYLHEEGHLSFNPVTGVERPKQKRTIITTFTQIQIEGMLAACKHDFTGIRNRAIILTLVDCGLRVTELCTLQLKDIDWTEQTMVVTGKGNKERIVPFGRSTRAALLSFFERRSDVPGVTTFFLTCYGEPLHREGVLRALKTVGKRAGITGTRISPHTFRHTCAVMYLRNGGDVFSLQKLLGHTDLTMTRRYAELSQSDVIDKHRRFSPADTIRTPNHCGAKRLR